MFFWSVFLCPYFSSDGVPSLPMPASCRRAPRDGNAVSETEHRVVDRGGRTVLLFHEAVEDHEAGGCGALPPGEGGGNYGSRSNAMAASRVSRSASAMDCRRTAAAVLAAAGARVVQAWRTRWVRWRWQATAKTSTLGLACRSLAQICRWAWPRQWSGLPAKVERRRPIPRSPSASLP